MECNKDEATRAKEIAEKKMQNDNFQEARKFALKAQSLFPGLENISQLITVCDVHCSAQSQSHISRPDKDWYGILQIERHADETTIKKQYRKLALSLHPDKNKFYGAEAAFKLIGEANMVLSDKDKRYLYDKKCKVSGETVVTEPPHHQVKRDSVVRNSRGVQNKTPKVSTSCFSGSNHRAAPPDLSNGGQTFWTRCSSCETRYQYYRDYVDRLLQCQNCTKSFTARDSGATFVSNRANPGSNGHPQVSEHKQVPKQDFKVSERVNRTTGVNGKAHVNTRDGNGGAKMSKVDTAKARELGTSRDENIKRKSNYPAEGSSLDPGAKKSRIVDEFVPNSNPDPSNPEHYECLDAEFNDFDMNKDEKCFSVDQVWACYDPSDGMPRFYAQVKKVFSTGFKLQFTWLEADPEERGEVNWVNAGLPVGCGKYIRGGTEKTSDRLTFSHQIHFIKGSTRGSYVLYPRKGETWALYKDWDIRWSTDPDNHEKYVFEIVEILSDFDHDTGIKVGYLEKIVGFVSLFQHTTRGGVGTFQISSSELLRFSHQIPSFKMTGTEREGVPEGSFELDPASLPTNPDEIWQPEEVKLEARNMNKVDQNVKSTIGSEKAGTPKKRMDAEKKTEKLRRSPRQFMARS